MITVDRHIERLVIGLRAKPPASPSTVDAHAELVGAYQVTVTCGAHGLSVDEPSSIGGADAGPTPVELALAALASCQAITYRIWGSRMGIAIDEVIVRCDGDYDPRGVLGVDGAPRPGFVDVRVEALVTGPDADRYDELRRAVDDHCPVLDLFRDPTPVVTTLRTTQGD